MKTTFTALCACVALVACSKSATTQPDPSQAAVNAETATTAVGTPAKQPSAPPAQAGQTDPGASQALPEAQAPAPTHSYSYSDNGQYGYESELSDADQKAGLVTKPLQMYRYIGRIDGRYIVESIDGNSATRATCESPCEFAKTLTVTTYGQTNSQVMRLPPNSILSAVFSDAINGQLVPSSSPATYLFPADWSLATVPARPVESQTAQDVERQGRQADQSVAVSAPVFAQPPATSVATIPAPSFDCSKARSDSEHLICGDPELANDDVQLAEIFARAKAAVTDQAAFKERTRVEWNYREQNCHDRDCLVRWYADQKTSLEHIAQTGTL